MTDSLVTPSDIKLYLVVLRRPPPGVRPAAFLQSSAAYAAAAANKPSAISALTIHLYLPFKKILEAFSNKK